MQLLSVTIYHHDGRRRAVNFRPGELNIVTGASRTGKSSLLNIVDYCLGRDNAPVPRTESFEAIAWYTTVWQFDTGGRVLLGRPANTSTISTSNAMIEFGGSELVSPPAEHLRINTDSDSLRDQVGARIGLGDAFLDDAADGSRAPSKVGLGLASIFSLQEQEEIGTKSLLFHRQSDPGIRRGLRDAFPYFLGAVDGEQAGRRARVRELRQARRRLEAVLAAERSQLSERDDDLRQLIAESRAVALIEGPTPESSDEMIAKLNQVRFYDRVQAPSADADLEAQDAQRAARDRHAELRSELAAAIRTRDLLLDQRSGEQGYDDTISTQIGRLQHIDLLGTPDGDATSCPLCMQQLPKSDQTVEEMQAHLEALRHEVEVIGVQFPKRQREISTLSHHIQGLRTQLNEAEAALTDSATGPDRTVNLAGRQEFVRGRVDALIGRLAASTPSRIEELERQVSALELEIGSLEDLLAEGEVREQVFSRVNRISESLREYSRALNLELAEASPIRLDIDKLTVVADRPSGPTPLDYIGSGENWVGYHVAAHLALHKFFVEQDRPVPRLLMLDQPSQAHFPSIGTPSNEDSTAVRNIFELLHRVTDDLGGRLQTIVIDHAEYPDEWFQSAIAHRWRDGVALIPMDWQVSPSGDE